MNKPSVVIIGPAHPLRGGLASYDERLARQFAREGHSVKIVTFSLQYPGFLFPGTTQYSTEPAPKDISIDVCINSINPINWIQIGNRLRRLRPDIIVVRYWLPFMGPCLGTILRRVKKNAHTKIVCIADNIIPHEKRIGDHAFTRYFIQPIDAFITMSEKVLQDLPSFQISKPSRLVPHPLYDNFGEKISQQEARQQLGINENEPLLLFFGFIRKYKGLDLLLEAMHLLKDKKVNDKAIKLLIAGEFYEDRSRYEQLIHTLGIQEQLYLHTDFIADSEVRNYLCAADAVIQPYRNATQSGVTPLAYHFEIPMIVTNVGGLPSLVPHDKVGLVCQPEAIALADSILEFYRKGKEYFLPQLQEEKKKYQWSKMTAAILEMANCD